MKCLVSEVIGMVSALRSLLRRKMLTDRASRSCQNSVRRCSAMLPRLSSRTVQRIKPSEKLLAKTLMLQLIAFKYDHTVAYLFLDVLRNVFLDAELLHRLLRDFDGLLLHLLGLYFHPIPSVVFMTDGVN